MINLKIRINVDEQVLALPVDTQFVPGIPEKDPVVMVTEITEPEELKYLERDEWNIEELNFLAKRMESFDKREQSQFESIDGVLYGTVTVKLTEQLAEDEEDTFKEWIVGQNADGLGEGFEQQDIETDEGILNVHFWDSTDDYYVESEDDFYENRINNGMGGIS